MLKREHVKRAFVLHDIVTLILFVRTEGGRSFAVTSCQLWNSLSLELRNSRDSSFALKLHFVFATILILIR